jgi:hypothetical protein
MEREDQGVLWCRCVISRRARIIKYSFVNNKRPIERHPMQNFHQRVERAIGCGRVEELSSLFDTSARLQRYDILDAVYGVGGRDVIDSFLQRPNYGLDDENVQNPDADTEGPVTIAARAGNMANLRYILQHPGYVPLPFEIEKAIFAAVEDREYDAARMLLRDKRFDPAAWGNAAVVTAFDNVYGGLIDNVDDRERAVVFAHELLRDDRVLNSLTDEQMQDAMEDETYEIIRTARDALRARNQRREEAFRAHRVARIADPRLPADYIAGFLNDEPRVRCTCGKCGKGHLSTSTTAAAGSS